MTVPRIFTVIHWRSSHESYSSQAHAKWKLTGVRPSRKTGCCGLWGQTFDILDKLRMDMLDLQEKVREARKMAINHGSTPAWCARHA